MATSSDFKATGVLPLIALMALHIFCIEGCMRSKGPTSENSSVMLKLHCPDDMEVVAEKRSSVASVSWGREDFSVAATYSINGIYQTVPIYGASSEVNRVFHDGQHYIEYKAVDEVGNFDQCSFTVTVRVIRCPSVYNPQYGVLTCSANNLFGSECSLSCIPGYSATGAKTLECLEDGSWSSELPSCRMTTCSDPGTPLHGTRSCTTNAHTYGSICSFDCPTGYQLLGNNRLICGSSGSWLADPPTCREIIPPRVEKCPPASIHLTTTGHFVEVEKPAVVFRTDAGHEAVHTCSHFGDGQKQNFSLGTHLVSCTAFDPSFGDKAIAKCEFFVRIKANPCRILPQPSNGSLLCSRAHGGGSATYDTICQLYCHTGFALARSDGIYTGEYQCDHTGTWLPSDIIPSCVWPKRPLEIQLPSEIYFTSPTCPFDPAHINSIRTQFQTTLQSMIPRTSPCSANSKNCIVEATSVNCHLMQPSVPPSRLRRYLLDGRSIGTGHIAKVAEERDRHVGRRVHSFRLTIQFHFGTKISEDSGDWPNEYHEATKRLFGMFDHLERQLQEGLFSVHTPLEGIQMKPVNDSLTFAPIKAVCDIGYSFNKTILMCVSCGPGSYYNVSLDRCVICFPGTYQDEQAAFECKSCLSGTTTIEKGATSISQCIDIDECLSSPCLNQGQCHNEHDRYTCDCLPGYSGVQCEEQVYDCKVHSCLNGGTCIPDGPDNYTCNCRSSYSGDYCQFFTVDGGWSDWSEWSACSKSCDGGFKKRSRSCDSPIPSHGGDPCPDAAVEEMVCNLQPCPECRKLRRPYQGIIHCEVNVTEDVTHCTIKCQDGYTFHGTVLPVYTCGGSTSHIWPHESPDNPRALLPACIEKLKPEEITYEFQSSLSLECTSEETRAALQQIIQDQATEMTENLECLKQGTCSLNAPHITGCHTGAGSSRRKRHVPQQKSVNVTVSLTYHVNDVPSSRFKRKDGDLDRTKEQVMNLGAQLMKESEIGSLFVEFNGSKVVVDSKQISTFNSVTCQPGTTPSEDGLHCFACAPGSYYSNDHQLCVLCEIGFFQPNAGKLKCSPCRDEMVTYGRGAISPLECYLNGTMPPDIPEDYYPKEPLSRDLHAAFAIVGGVIVFAIVVFIFVFVITWKRNRRQKDYSPKTAGMRTRWAGQTHEQVHLCAVGSLTEEKA